MIKLKMASNVNELMHLLDKFQNELEPELVKSLNWSTAKMRQTMAEHIAKVTNLDLDEDIKPKKWRITKATEGAPVAELETAGYKLPLIKFVPAGERRRMEGKNNKGGVQFMLFGQKRHRPQSFTHDLKRTNKNDQPAFQVFNRKRFPGKPNDPRPHGQKQEYKHRRFKLYIDRGLSIPRIAEEDEVVAAGVNEYEQQFFKKLDRAMHSLVKDML